MSKTKQPEYPKTPVMEAWEIKCLGGRDLREYLREARFGRGMGRVAIARELQAKARVAGHKDFSVSDSTVGFALNPLGLQSSKRYEPVNAG